MTHRGMGPGVPRGYLERARALMQRAQAHGATLAAWSAATLSFAWDTASTEEVIGFAVSLGADAADAKDSDAWSCAIAQGDMELLSPPAGPGESTRPPPARGDLAWGPALVAAVALARIARPGEVLLDESLEALRSGELLKLGGRSGVDGGKPIRGARLDTRLPWKAEGAARIASLVEVPLLGRGELVEAILGCVGAASVIRAEPGFGGSRLLAEIAARAARSLVVSPAGLGVEPLGALRQALLRRPEELVLPADLAQVHARLLAGEGVAIEAAASLLERALAAPPGALGKGAWPAALVIDDAEEVDGVSLEVCARVLKAAATPVALVVRLATGDALHPALAALPLALEVGLDALEQDLGEKLAQACTGGALPEDACQRWARRGSYTPLGIVEAIACSLATGDIAWVADSAFVRRRFKGKGKPQPASAWIHRRAEELPAEARAVLSALALVGGEASWDTVDSLLSAVGAKVDLTGAVADLVAARWLTEWTGAKERRLELRTRTHCAVVRELVPEGRRRAWHRAAALTLADSGPLGRAEAAYHASDAGDGPWAARLALEAATAAAESHLEGSALRLRAFAKSCDEKRHLDGVPASGSASVDSEPPTIMAGRAAARDAASPVSAHAGNGSRPLDLDALTGTGTEEELAGAPGVLAQRMRAITELSHGQIAHAVDLLRATHGKLQREASSPSTLCQASLVLGVALAHSGQTEEALLQGLDALARAREGRDEPGEHACVTFLTKLFDGTSHAAAAQKVRAATAAGKVGP
jgi:hypothetical protein